MQDDGVFADFICAHLRHLRHLRIGLGPAGDFVASLMLHMGEALAPDERPKRLREGWTRASDVRMVRSAWMRRSGPVTSHESRITSHFFDTSRQ